ncbi:MAG: sugar ABC transporter permease [Oscillospiraceae bacterium]|nr:sugar ABC transporter permease [Oscillospiraceae bacterium]
MKKSKTMLAVFIAPAVLTFLIAFLYPIIRTVYMSFFALENVTDKMDTWSFVGTENFITLFTQSPLYVQSMSNITRIWLIGGAGVFVTALLFSAILTSGIRFKSFFRAVIYLPNVVSAVAMGTMWVQYVYNPRFGLVSTVLNFLGFKELAQTQLTSPAYVFYALMIAYSFGMVGYFLLIFVAAIDGIPFDYFEAATIEGANFFNRFFSITLPLIAENIRTCIVLWSVAVVNFFAWSMVFSPLQPENGTVSPVVYMYQLVFGSNIMSTVQRNVGVGAAVGVTLSLFVIVIFGATSFIFRKYKVEY